MDEIDKESLHLLVFLFMQFLSHPDQAVLVQSEEKQHTKVHPSSRALQSLFSLLGYNEHERRFTTMPHKVRSTPAINAFLANLYQVLDNNFKIGEQMLLNVILVLQKIPFPPPYATSWQSGYTLMQESHMFQGCGFSLWHLEPSLRKNWLSAVLVIVYKYNYSPEEVVGEKLVGLIRIIIHTLAAHAHVCDRFGKPIMGFQARSRDLSQISLGNADADNDTVFDGDDNLDDNASANTNVVEEEAQEDTVDGKVKEAQVEEMKNIDEEEITPTVETMANLFELLPKPNNNNEHNSAAGALASANVAPTPDHHQMTSEGLPEGWAMQLMHSGRTLFIDNTNQST